jgi:hypothetical protein
MTPVTHGTTGVSGWLELPTPGKYRIDVDVPAGVSAISYTMETLGPGATVAKTASKPNDVDANWTVTKSIDVEMCGPARFRVNVASRTGTGDVVITAAQVK